LALVIWNTKKIAGRGGVRVIPPTSDFLCIPYNQCQELWMDDNFPPPHQ